MPALTGLTKSKAEKRIAEIAPLLSKSLLASSRMRLPLKPEANDLLKIINPKRDAVEGAWALERGTLTSPITDYSRLVVPFKPPEEYTLHMTVRHWRGRIALPLDLS